MSLNLLCAQSARDVSQRCVSLCVTECHCATAGCGHTVGMRGAGGSTGMSGQAEDPVISSNISSRKSESLSPLLSEGKVRQGREEKGYRDCSTPLSLI